MNNINLKIYNRYIAFTKLYYLQVYYIITWSCCVSSCKYICMWIHGTMMLKLGFPGFWQFTKKPKDDWLIGCMMLMPFSTVSQCIYPWIPGFLLTRNALNILSELLAAFPHNHVETMDSGKRGINPVGMNIINPRKDGGSNRRSPLLKSCTWPTELSNR